MESVGAFPYGEWDCFARMSADGELDYSPQFLAHSSFLFGEDDGLNIGIQPTFSSASEAGENENEKNTSSFIPTDISMEETLSLNEDGSTERLENSDYREAERTVVPARQLQLKRKLDVPEQEVPGEEKRNVNSSENQKKKPRISREVQRCQKNTRPKKNQKLTENGNEEEETNAGSDGQSSSSYSSEDVDAISQENSGGTSSTSKSPMALNVNGKTRASRGSATDPQSLYARKRRERINERLRILQNLVPNGSKVDMSTMLEEAVHYVKFLQLQIKLLSSDDLWMYAPIAYNGIDIGLDLNRKISPPPL
ncbi:hypothetical protein L6164_024591 [Bauhinia variegata]|uniref:Uncharacterized protein n=1 Tax=Bauhinia variegata TaxID=167791 RepID=A0ACB9LXZ4_BAUVA|nr:hypothetical protein L6164_024591 [Bauhinia variegata]